MRDDLSLRCLLVMALACLLGGCGGPSVSSRADALSVKAAANVTRNTAETWDSAFYGVTPTNVEIDQTGASVQTGGPNTVMGIQFTQGETRIFTSNPSDMVIERMSASLADGTHIDLEGLSSTKSVVIAAYDRQVIEALRTQGDITEAQAEVAKQALETGATLAEAIARAVIK